MGRRKRRSARKSTVCSVCQMHYNLSTSVTPPCSSPLVVPRHTICNSCLYKHILTSLSHDITNRVMCPEQECHAKITDETIRSILVTFNRPELWEDYTLKSSWHSTSEQWIKRFAARCPNCRVPIEKNGGCNRVIHNETNIHSHYIVTFVLVGNNMNPFGGNPFGGGLPQQFPGSFPQQGFGQFGSSGGGGFSGGGFSGGGFSGGGGFNGGIPFQGGNVFPSGSAFPPPPPFSGFASPPIGGQFEQQGFGFPPAAGGFGYQQPPYAPQFPPGQQPPFGNPNYFGSGAYGRPRPRRSSRHGSKSRRRRSSTSSSSSDENRNRGSPFAGPGVPYANLQPFPNMPPLSPRSGSPFIPPRQPMW